MQIEPWEEPFEPHETSSRPINLVKDMEVLVRMIVEVPDCRMVVIDPHPVAKYRVIGPLSNMPEFYRAFGCKRGDAMVRENDKQCRVW